MMNNFRFGLSVLLFVCTTTLATENIRAAEVADTPALLDPDVTTQAEDPATEEDRFGRDTPQGAMRGFLLAADLEDLERATQYLDLRYLKGEATTMDPQILAEQLIVVLEREIDLDLDILSPNPEGWLSDGLPEYRDQIGQIMTSNGELILFLQHVPDAERDLVWKISNRTVSQIPDLYEEFGYSGVTAWIQSVTPEGIFLGAEYFKWAAGLLAALVAALPIWLVNLGIAKLLTARYPNFYVAVRKFFIGPFTWLLIFLIAGGVMADLGLGVTGQSIIQAKTIPTVLTIWMLLAAINLLRDICRQHLQRRGKVTSASLLRPIANSLKVVIILLGAILWLNNIGYEITALMAGLGVGGLALALVLQKPLEDVFGAVSLFMQQPVKVGNFCHTGDITGTIEEISLRSTRIRTLANSVVTVPNSTMAANAIENLSARTKILHNPVIRLSLDSTTEQIRFVLEHVQKLLDEHADVQKEGARVRFQSFGYHALELSIFVYIMKTDYAAFLQIAEGVNLSVLEIVAESGTKLAVPVDAVGDGRA